MIAGVEIQNESRDPDDAQPTRKRKKSDISKQTQFIRWRNRPALLVVIYLEKGKTGSNPNLLS